MGCEDGSDRSFDCSDDPYAARPKRSSVSVSTLTLLLPIFQGWKQQKQEFCCHEHGLGCRSDHLPDHEPWQKAASADCSTVAVSTTSSAHNEFLSPEDAGLGKTWARAKAWQMQRGLKWEVLTDGGRQPLDMGEARSGLRLLCCLAKCRCSLVFRQEGAEKHWVPFLRLVALYLGPACEAYCCWSHGLGC